MFVHQLELLESQPAEQLADIVTFGVTCHLHLATIMVGYVLQGVEGKKRHKDIRVSGALKLL